MNIDAQALEALTAEVAAMRKMVRQIADMHFVMNTTFDAGAARGREEAAALAAQPRGGRARGAPAQGRRLRAVDGSAQ